MPDAESDGMNDKWRSSETLRHALRQTITLQTTQPPTKWQRGVRVLERKWSKPSTTRDGKEARALASAGSDVPLGVRVLNLMTRSVNTQGMVESLNSYLMTRSANTVHRSHYQGSKPMRKKGCNETHNGTKEPKWELRHKSKLKRKNAITVKGKGCDKLVPMKENTVRNEGESQCQHVTVAMTAVRLN
ncbi:hypothetical protein BC835DRAFT_1310068 [Cytidiella melzeri]|nr:hypothetical protein BC835DRAFT_1310068 [Cytidiella melzeri]